MKPDTTPETSSLNVGSEQISSREADIIKGVERKSSQNNEALIDTGVERMEQVAEANAAIADVSSVTNVPPQTVDDSSATTDDDATNDNPIVAKDDDLVEKEWVDRAKKIVAETKDDPHRQEKEVSKLQVDYMKKRFGREIGVTE